MHKFLLVSFLLVSLSMFCKAQDFFLKRDGLDLGKDRYEKMKNAPYLFKDFTSVTLIDRFGHEHKEIKVNYNGYTGELEIELEGKLVALNGFSYPKFIVDLTKDVFVNAFLKNGSYVKLIFDGEKARYYTQFVANIDDKGKKFNSQEISYIERGGKTTILTKDVDLISAINDPSLKEYATKYNLKPTEQSAIISLLTQYENN